MSLGVKVKIELYKSTPHGIRYWSVEPDYIMGTIIIEHGKLNGALQHKEEDVEENNSGRSLDEQIGSRMDSRINAKKDIGYRLTIEDAKKAEGNNTLGYHRPMLATRLDRIRNVDYDNAYLQMKYDGHRCLITRTPSGLVAYSRNGKRITTIDHVLNGIRIPSGCTIDGELYCHNTPLQTISSWAKRKQANTEKLKFIVYDYVSSDGYRERYNFIHGLELGRNAEVAPTDKNIKEDQIALLLSNSRALGYEGLILRNLDTPYEVGKRSKGLIKVKQFLDSEFQVIDIIPSVEGWARLICRVNDRVTFRASAPGTIYQKQLVLREKEKFIGKYVTVSFANYTIEGKPFHPTAERWRQEI